MTTNNSEIKTCRTCRTTFQERTNDDEFSLAWLMELCDPCLADHEAYEAKLQANKELEREKRIAENKAEAGESASKATPELFRKTDINHPKFNLTAWTKIKNHKLTEEFPWIGFAGMTGRCKTRLAFLYAKEEIIRLTDARKASFEFVASYEITDAVTRLNCDFEAKHAARKFLDRLRVVDVLLIDDLGKGRLTPTAAAELFALIDYRHAHLMPTIWTSNGTPDAIAAGLPEDMAGPFAGRITGSSKIFSFK